MKINVYNEELTRRIELHEKTARNTGAKFYGLHFYLHSPRQLHRGRKDDDTSAVVLWGSSPKKLLALLAKAAEVVKKSMPVRRSTL
jgi:hypothetical protein